jgi:FtsP/CotA-like multicopper oxidase with cupredoxin domain
MKPGRRWLALAGSVALASLVACGGTARTVVSAKGPTHAGHMPAQTAPAPATGGAAVDMDAEHEASVKAFPAKTAGLGDRVLRPTVEAGLKTFELTVAALRWEISPGAFVEAFAYNGQIPGPQIRVRRGDRIRVVVHNRLPESTAVHFHGIEVPNAMDGVPFITQPPIKTGETFTYEFVVREPPGSYMYHSHFNATQQVGKGLLGAFIVEPARRTWDIEQNVILGDGELGFTLNGKSFPATAPIVAKVGQRVLIRFMNAGQQLHPMHLHGVHFTVIARDGRPVDPYEADTITVAPGERWDVILDARLPGVWALHCHILPHVETEHGMYGMVTAVVIT